MQYKGAIYHITSRGNEKTPLFLCDDDRVYFLYLLSEVVMRYHFKVYAYCLMGNHYHLLVETPRANLSEGMRQLNGVYAQRFNRNRERVGHLFQGRFSAKLIRSDAYLLACSRYIVLNPVRSGIATHPRKWDWSSYMATAGLIEAPLFLDTDYILSYFSENKGAAILQYLLFIESGVANKSQLPEAKGGLLLGGRTFVSEIREKLKKDIPTEVTKRERHAARPDIEEIFSDHDIDKGIYEAVYTHGYKLREVGEFLGMHYSVVSRAAKKYRSKIK